MMRFSRRMLLLGAVSAVIAARTAATAQTIEKTPVLATFSIIADIARNIGGDRVAVAELIGPDQDAHGYQPSPADAKKIAAARIIFANGLGFEPYLEKLTRSAGAKIAPVLLGSGIKPLNRGKDADHGHNHGGSDPHAWQAVGNVKIYAAAIARALGDADPAGKTAYDSHLASYVAKLDALDAEIRTAIGSIPQERRLLTTTHDAFGYFAAEYGLKIQALQGVQAESEPSAADMARIIRQLRTLKAPAVFLENVSDPRKLEQIARESGAKVGGTLYSDALSLANGPAPTYIDMMRHNVREIAKALAPQA